MADIATGTGIILTELAKSHPETCRFDGFDVSDAQFPAKLPNNVKLHITNVKEPLPTEYHGQFDVVYIRYLNAAMRPHDWKTVTRNVSQLLKPGGWLQWIEGDFCQAASWVRLDASQISNGAAQEACELMGRAKDILRYFSLELADIFRDVGLTNVIQEITSSDRIPEMRPIWADNNIGPLTAFLMRTQSMQDGGKSPEYCSKLRDNIMDEANAGIIYARFDIHTFLGQKK